MGRRPSLDRTVSSVDTDSRGHPSRFPFLPLVGERFDGHAYLAAALEAGAAGCLTAREPEHYQEGRFYIRVEDTQRALRDLAFWYKEQFRIPFVGVTGSVGKTTAKDMIASVLSVKYKVLKTEGNFNNNVGLPLTLLRLDRSFQIGVVEMGMASVREIYYLGDIVRPEVGVITNIGDAHIERLGSRENIFRAEVLVAAPHPEGKRSAGPQWGRRPPVHPSGQDPGSRSVLRQRGGLGVPGPVGQQRGAGLPAQPPHYAGHGPGGVHPSLGQPHDLSHAHRRGGGQEHFRLTADDIEQGIARFVPTRMRMNLVQRGDGITILDDTYNANPQSMRAAISRAGGQPQCLGSWQFWGYVEVGALRLARPPHRSGEYLGKRKIDCPAAVGEQARYLI